MLRRWIVLLLCLASVILGRSDALTISPMAAQAASCPITQPNPATTPPSSIDPSSRPAGLNWLWYGNRYLWTQLPPASTAREKKGAGVKFPWWRLLSGKLSITGHPVGASTPRLRADIPDGYGDLGFQATGLYFPSYGCWRITGHVHGKNISFVLKVKPAKNSSP